MKRKIRLLAALASFFILLGANPEPASAGYPCYACSNFCGQAACDAQCFGLQWNRCFTHEFCSGSGYWTIECQDPNPN
jgi:hypothetical protein